MHDERDGETPVRVKAHLVDPDTMTVSWMNESAAQGFAPDAVALGVPVEQVVPAPGAESAREIVRAVAEEGVARHLRGDVVSTRQGSLAMVTSLYRVPGGAVLVLTENAWIVEHGKPETTGSARGRRRSR
jgi:hypothetical protein